MALSAKKMTEGCELLAEADKYLEGCDLKIHQLNASIAPQLRAIQEAKEPIERARKFVAAKMTIAKKEEELGDTYETLRACLDAAAAVEAKKSAKG